MVGPTHSITSHALDCLDRPSELGIVSLVLRRRRIQIREAYPGIDMQEGNTWGPTVAVVVVLCSLPNTPRSILLGRQVYCRADDHLHEAAAPRVALE